MAQGRMIVTLSQPSRFTRYETSAQERTNERKAEEKRVERLLAILSKKLGTTDKGRNPYSSAA
jgi:hypothetical protein